MVNVGYLLDNLIPMMRVRISYLKRGLPTPVLDELIVRSARRLS